MNQPKILIFDLDGTLTPSKQPLQEDMAEVLCKLLVYKKIVVIGGGSKAQFFDQFVSRLVCDENNLGNLYLMPTSGASLYVYEKAWKNIYNHFLTDGEKKKILDSLSKTIKDVGYVAPAVIYGEVIEDRQNQITFSANGQKAPLEIKSKWDPDRKKRLPMVEKLKEYLPEFDIKIGGTNTIDITKKGINKAYGVEQITKFLNLQISDAIYIGDALYENGNDAIVKESGIETIQISGPEETKKILEQIITENK